MRRTAFISAAVTALFACLPATVAAAGGELTPQAIKQATPAVAAVVEQTTPNVPVVTPTVPAACTPLAAPPAIGTTVTSTGVGLATPDPGNGGWVITIESQGNGSTSFRVNWQSPDPAQTLQYHFEVSNDQASDPTTGNFITPISADTYDGTNTQSASMYIDDTQPLYFHIRAISDATNSCTGIYTPATQVAVNFITFNASHGHMPSIILPGIGFSVVLVVARVLGLHRFRRKAPAPYRARR